MSVLKVFGAVSSPVMDNNFLTIMAIGDAFGMKLEFVEHDTTLRHNDLFYAPHPKFTDFPPGHYSDDTQMSIANAELCC